MNKIQLLLLGFVGWLIMYIGALLEDRGLPEMGYIIAIFGALIFCFVLLRGVVNFFSSDANEEK